MRKMNSVIEKKLLVVFKKLEISNRERKLTLEFFRNYFNGYYSLLVKNDNLTERKLRNQLCDIKRDFFSASDEILKKGTKLTKRIKNKDLVRQIKNIFRSSIKKFIIKSKVVKRAIKKPRGYPGDYKIIEMMYDNKTISKGIGSVYDRYFLDSDYVLAVRQRKDFMRKYLLQFVNSEKSINNEVEILNIGCGSCREISEILKHINKKKDIKFVCIDQDEYALEYSKKRLKNILSFYPNNELVFNFIKDNILALTRRIRECKKDFHKYDLIYSIGLVDYLSNSILTDLITLCLLSLKKDGILVFAYKEVKQYEPSAPDWFSDWHFYSRNNSEYRRILNYAANAAQIKINVSFEKIENKHITFITVKRK